MANSQSPLSIEAISGRHGRRRFINVSKHIYGGDSQWVAPLFWERWLHLSGHNPYFEHARWQAWIVSRDDVPVGRISAQIDQLHLEQHQDATGFFGLFEAVDDKAVFKLLMDSAETWLRAAGMQRIRGPFNLSINHDCGLLVDGFDTPPAVMMPHGQPYYPARLAELGYSPAQDMLAYSIASDFAVPKGMQMLTAKSSDQIQLRPLNRKRLNEDFSVIREIFNDAWAKNWGFVPFTAAEFLDIGNTLVHLVKDDFVQIGEIDGRPVGMIILLPNLNELINDLDGRLLPIGWLKLIWRLKRNGARSGRIPLMGITQEYQGSLLGTAMVYRLIGALRDPAQREGIAQVEMSWILDNNLAMRNIIESLGGVAYKRYRIFEKGLGDA